MTATVTPHPVDDVDGLPVSAHAPGDPLPDGSLAWERLGVGQRCETWLAWSQASWCPLVVKFPRPHQRHEQRARLTLEREVAALAGLVHPSLPRLVADGTAADMPFLVFEHLDGASLDVEVDVLGVQVLAALRLVHGRGIAHLDVKTENIVLTRGRPVLLDFGSARRVGSPQPAGRPIGSAGYAAPELEAGAPIGPAMDLYGVGATVHELLAGEPTFDAGLDAADRPPAAPLPPGAGTLAGLVAALLDPDPGHRPDLATALDELGRFAAAQGRESAPSWAAVPR